MKDRNRSYKMINKRIEIKKKEWKLKKKNKK